MSEFHEYPNYDGLGLAELVRQKQVSALELVEAAIERIERHNPALNAVVYKMYDAARDTAKKPLSDGPFAGVPMLLKDLIDTVAGVPTSSGNKLWRNIPARQDSELVRRWKKAGVILLGKTNTPEFGLTPFTESLALGPARNPWDTSRTPGGSSGGSIRIPASACGLFGLKPSRGRTPLGPEIGEAWNGFVIEHILSRSVRDSAAMLDATQGADSGAPYAAPSPGSFLEALGQSPGKMRIAFSGRPMLGKNVSPEVLQGLESSVKLLQELGHELVEDAPAIDGEAFSLAFVKILAAEMRADIEEAARAAGKKVSVDDFDPASFGLGMLGGALSAEEYASASRYLKKSARQVSTFFEKYDLLLTPVLAQPPVKIGALQPAPAEKALISTLGRINGGGLLKLLGIIKPLAAQTFEFIPWTPVFNVTGQPAMSAPLHWTESGLPVGMHFIAKFGDEASLFRLAGQLEQAHPWRDKIPAGY